MIRSSLTQFATRPGFAADRRSVLQGLTALGALALPAAAAAATSLPARPAPAAATDADYWAAVRGLYKVTSDVVNLENGYWGIMAEPVRREFARRNDEINFENSFYARARFGADLEKVRVAVAGLVGADPEEIALTRNATEALKLLIANYNRLKPGDAVLYADLDYDAMQRGMRWLKERRNVDVTAIDLPEPATRQAVIDAYDQALKANAKIRLLLLTHISHRTGLMLPVAEITRMARERGVDVILDAAHSVGQIDYRVADLGADFIGFNLHKWVGAPIGAGFLYIRKDRIADIDRDMGDEEFAASDIRSRVHTGTYNFATMLTVPAAIALHQEIGPQAKQNRLRHLRDTWVSRARAIKGVEILTPDEPGMAGALTSFRLAGKTTKQANDAVVAALRDRHKVLTVRRAGVAKGDCIRVTPALYTSEADLDRFVAALETLAGSEAQ
jgi:isopenicillin-N epimerase